MDPAKLLRETERAAGKDLLETHNLLAEKQQELKTLALVISPHLVRRSNALLPLDLEIGKC